MSSIQQESGVEDSVHRFAYDTMVSGNLGDSTGIEFGLPNALVNALSTKAAAAIQFLADKGADLTNLVQLGGHSSKRTHRPQGGKPAGWTFVSAVKKSLEGKVTYKLGHKVEKILKSEDGSVIGIQFIHEGNPG